MSETLGGTVVPLQSLHEPSWNTTYAIEPLLERTATTVPSRTISGDERELFFSVEGRVIKVEITGSESIRLRKNGVTCLVDFRIKNDLEDSSARGFEQI
jgi:hypothetical protein